MASELLKTFQKIESGRQLQITKARELGNVVQDNASLSDLASYIQRPGNVVKNRVYKDLPVWERPKEWVDGKSILRNAEIIEDMMAGAFVLVKVNDPDNPTTTLYPTSDTSNYKGSGCDGYLMSDGTWYNTATGQTHTWNPEYAMVVPDGDLAGTYYWYLGYYKKANRASYTEQFGHASEIILGIVNYGHAENVSSRCLTGRNTGYGALINFEVLPESNIRTLSAGNLAYEDGFNLSNIRHIDFGPITKLGSPSYSTSSQSFKFESPYLRELDLTGITINMATNYPSPHIGVLIDPRYLKVFKCDTNVLVTARYPLSNMEEFYLPNGELRFMPYESANVGNAYVPFIVPQTDKFIIGSFERTYPDNWIAAGATNLSQLRTAKSSYSSHLCDGHPLITTINLHSSHMVSGTPVVGENSPSLSVINVNDGWDKSINFSNCDLTHGCLIDIFDKLYDYTGTSNTRALTIGEHNIDKLTEDELKTATDKGWSVI